MSSGEWCGLRNIVDEGLWLVVKEGWDAERERRFDEERPGGPEMLVVTVGAGERSIVP